MAGEIEEPFRLNFQADLLQSGSISFGRFESESLSWERRSIFPHNRYLEEVEKYSKPGTVTEKKAYFEAEFRRKALLKQRSSECQESTTVTNSDMHDFEEYSNCNDGTCSSNTSNCNTETVNIQDYEKDTSSQHSESHNHDHDFDPVTTQKDLGETCQSENENVVGNTEQSVESTLVDHVVLVDVSSEANVDSQIPAKVHDSISSLPRATFSPKVKPVADKKLTRSTVKTQANADWSKKQVLNGGSKGLMKSRTSDSKVLLPVKKTEKKSPRPASPLIPSGGRSLKVEELRSEKAVKVKAPLPLLEKSFPGVRSPVVNRSKPNVNPNKIHLSQSAIGFSFKTDQRAENRKEFHTKIAERMHAKEVVVNQVEAKSLEKQADEMKQFRKSLNFKAKPLPSFYNKSGRVLDQPKVTPISKTPRPRSQAMATQHDKKNTLNIRPSSSSANRIIRISESVGVSENKEKEKISKLKEPRSRDMVKKHVKGSTIHTWNGPKVGVVS